METITIHGITYNVIASRTPSQMEQNGYLNVAHQMRTNGIVQTYDLQRPKGYRFYSVMRYDTCVFGKVAPLF